MLQYGKRVTCCNCALLKCFRMGVLQNALLYISVVVFSCLLLLLLLLLLNGVCVCVISPPETG